MACVLNNTSWGALAIMVALAVVSSMGFEPCSSQDVNPGSHTAGTCDFESTAFIQRRQQHAADRTLTPAPAQPCSTSLSSKTLKMRDNFNQVFFELYGAKMTFEGMAGTHVRPHWPDMSEAGSAARRVRLMTLKEDLGAAFDEPNQALYDKNAISRMQLLVSERLRGETIRSGASGLPVALSMDLFPQDTRNPSQTPFYYYPGIYQLLNFVRSAKSQEIPSGLQTFPTYLEQWSSLLVAAQEAVVIPQESNFKIWNSVYMEKVQWDVAFPSLSKELLQRLDSSLADFQEKLRAYDPLFLKAYGPDKERGYSALGKVGQDIFLWRLTGWGMDFTAEEAILKAKDARAGAAEMSRQVVDGLSAAFGEDMDVAAVLAMINDQNGPLYYQDMSWEEMATNLTSVYNNILKNTSNVFGTLSNCNTAVYPCNTLPKEFFPGGCDGFVFPAFGLNPPACNENGECRTPQYLILGRSEECFANLTMGKACMDYMIPLMTPTMIHEGLGHWLQETQCPPPPCDPDLPVVDTFQEGWGTYCEGLGVELGQYDDSTWGRLGRVGWAMGKGLRMCRFFLEHDVNYGNKTRTEAEEEWNNYPFASPTLYESNAMDFIIDTCQRSSYYPTLELMTRQQSKAKDSLGDKFSLPLFNRFMGTLVDQLTPAMVEEAGRSFIDCSKANNCFG